jgi:hypothetical protein
VSTSSSIDLQLKLGMARICKAAKQNPVDIDFDFQ